MQPEGRKPLIALARESKPFETDDVPLFADVSRIHAALTRDAECYLLEASKAVSLT